MTTSGTENKIELFNVADDVPVYTGAQRLFNILGNLREPETVDSLSYSLNDGPETPVFFKFGDATANRLAHPGDFNIDTIGREQLQADNTLVVTASLRDGGRQESAWRFPKAAGDSPADYRLDLNNAAHPQQVSQIVDGRWRVAGDSTGDRRLEIRPEDAGLDRVILFGRDDLGTGYTIRARLMVTSWTGTLHNVGLLFKWNPHFQGDGTYLPSKWSTGLGYYYSHCPGLRIRYGVDVHLDAQRRKVGDYILAEAPLSHWRYWAKRLGHRFVGDRPGLEQVVPGVMYHFELRIEEGLHALTVWKAGRRKPRPRVVVENPPQLLDQGAAGIIAHRCGVRVFDFAVESV
jgi:hypothetical protein